MYENELTIYYLNVESFFVEIQPVFVCPYLDVVHECFGSGRNYPYIFTVCDRNMGSGKIAATNYIGPIFNGTRALCETLVDTPIVIFVVYSGPALVDFVFDIQSFHCFRVS